MDDPEQPYYPWDPMKPEWVSQTWDSFEMF